MINNWHRRVLQLPRPIKRLVMATWDIFAISVALWSAFALRFSEVWPEPYLSGATSLFVFSALVGVTSFYFLGLYRAVLRYLNMQILFLVAVGVLILVVSLYLFAYATNMIVLPRSVPLIFGLSCGLFIGGSRLLYRSYFHWWESSRLAEQNALIYGADEAGVQLVAALQASGDLSPVGFVDNNPKLERSVVAGLVVYSHKNLAALVERKNVQVVLLARENISASERKVIFDLLAKLPVKVKTMPPLREVIDGKPIDDLREVDITDLLGRDMVTAHEELLCGSIKNKSVCITGAGGSIGSELARQALINGATTLVLYELSESALYNIERELTALALSQGSNAKIYPIIGSVLNETKMLLLFQRFQVNTLFHAAAYKHVPLVESNVLEGLNNNTIGTMRLARAANEAGLERFVLISTDKAVRPTNVMGATKRFAEICVQYFAQKPDSKTNFSIVRFGNVLGSSGSVVPLFRDQIAYGGPVTVTHPEINRFFMTVSEASSLVIQAGTMAKGGEVFVLDMGEPIKISQLAESMINLSGLSVKSSQNPNGDIEIIYSGLRPGEKLYEELLLGDNVIETPHKKILCAREHSLSEAYLMMLLSKLQKAIDDNNSEEARLVLMQAVEEFKPGSENVDWLYDKYEY